MVRHTDNAVVVDAPMGLVRDMANDVTTWPSLFGEYSAAEVLETRGDTVRFWLAIRKAGVLVGAPGFDGYNSSVLIRRFRPAE